MNINYEYYKIFYYAAKNRSFSRTAKVLLTNQPNITRVIKILEGELGCTLFNRMKNGVTLTPEGEILYEHISKAVELITEGEDEISKANDLQSGTVTISVTETALHGVMLPLLNEFHERYPGIKIKLLNHSTPQALTALKSGIANLAVVTMPISTEGSLNFHKLREFRELIICSTKLKDLAKRTLTLEELCSHPIISLNRNTRTYDFYSDFFFQHGIDFQPDIEVATADQIMPLVKSNLGIGLIPEPMAQSGDVYILKTDEEFPKRSIVLAENADKKLNAAATEIQKMILKKCNIFANAEI